MSWFGTKREQQEAHPQTCERCPHRYSERGCPAWLSADNGFVEENPRTGETRVLTGCFYQVWPRIMSYVVMAANRPAAVLQEWRNEMAQGLGRLSTAIEMATRIEDKRDDKGN